MEYIRQRTLKEHITEQPLSATETATVLYQALRSLEYTHSQQQPILHRNINPSNILVDSRGTRLRVTLANFSSAREGGPARATGRNLPYSAPEAYLESQTYDSLADIRSLGVVILECLYRGLPDANRGTPEGPRWAIDIVNCAVNLGLHAKTLRQTTNDPEILLHVQLYAFILYNMVRAKRMRKSAAFRLAAEKSTVFAHCIDQAVRTDDESVHGVSDPGHEVNKGPSQDQIEPAAQSATLQAGTIPGLAPNRLPLGQAQIIDFTGDGEVSDQGETDNGESSAVGVKTKPLRPRPPLQNDPKRRKLTQEYAGVRRSGMKWRQTLAQLLTPESNFPGSMLMICHDLT